jgi:hypothetical protein
LKSKKLKKDSGNKITKKGTKLKSKIIDSIIPETNSTTGEIPLSEIQNTPKEVNIEDVELLNIFDQPNITKTKEIINSSQSSEQIIEQINLMDEKNKRLQK